jgi:4-hydroxy-tetrahydrodipicolinate reductase
MKQTRIAIHGAAGRMGRRLVALGAADPELAVVAALESPDHPRLGDDSGAVAGIDAIGVPLSGSLDAEADVMIDFSLPEAVETIAAICAEAGVPLVSATTGLSDEQADGLRAAAEKIPVLWAPNMSLAVNLTTTPTWRSSSGTTASRRTPPAARH